MNFPLITKSKFHAPYRTRYFLSLLIFILLSEGRAGEKWKPYKMWRFSVSGLNLSLNSSLTVPLHLHSFSFLSDGIHRVSIFERKILQRIYSPVMDVGMAN